GNGIMHMQHVEFLETDHIHQLARQCEFVRREVEQWIFGYRHLVVIEVFRKEIQSGGLAVGDEMNLVPVGSQSLAQFRSDYTASTKGGITYDTDLHVLPFVCCQQSTDKFPVGIFIR